MSVGVLDSSKLVELLNDVVDPCSVATGMPLGLPEMGLVAGIDIDEGRVQVKIRLSSPGCYMLGYFTDEIRKRLLPVAGVASVDVEFDEGFEWDASFMSTEVQERRRRAFLRLDELARTTGSIPRGSVA